MAERLRNGLNALMNRHGISGCAYGESSTCHLLFGASDPAALTPAQIRAVPPALVAGLRGGLLARGVDLMSHTSCVTSLAHTPELIDEALAAFDDVLAELARDGVVS
jgi:glutamate-1-semialdehyde 2,1-aminomutase